MTQNLDTNVWVNQDEAGTISPFDRGLAYGDGLFATIQTNNGVILLLDAHLARLHQGAVRLGINWSPTESFIAHLKQLAASNPNHCIKVILSRGNGGRGYMPPEHAKLTEITSVHPLPSHYPIWQREGIKLALSEVELGRQPLLAGIKHLNRLEQVLIKAQPLANDVQDWLVVDTQGKVIESSMANLFAIKSSKVYTPSMAYSGVAGVTRERVIDALLQFGLSVECTEFDVTFLQSCDHVMLSNSLFGVVDVTTIGNQVFERFAETKKLTELIYANEKR
ncbi:aminodeoxychorismate lyase [Shewanella maritima]|uniref:Aminodeoxychorismate lyase n=1 Tax=Shewanella maritima TaxID=2520507 RepID=A0A411PM13_9GAMM|nr:aminodeoxychorismate lyase [Shewanella maritima]QBF84562.1 aminodeoxychorismate lyase [Shewanella maritima]